MDNSWQDLDALNDDKMQRNEFFEDLLHKITCLEEENAMLKRDIQKTTVFSDDFLADVNRDAAVISSLQQDIVNMLGNMVYDYPQQPQQEYDHFDSSTPFVVVLIDGDRVQLLDEHIKEGSKGGVKAAKRFYDHLMQYLIHRRVFEQHWKLIVKFYASMSRLGTNYIKSGIIDDLTTWRSFIDGFNNTCSFCCFVDADDGQQSINDKIQSQLELFFGHCNCQHTILLGNSDNTYTGFLRQYSKSDNICGRLTMVEAIPFPGEFHELASKFLPKTKDTLFSSKDFTPPPTPEKGLSLATMSTIPASLLPGPKPKPLPLLSKMAPSDDATHREQHRSPSPRRQPPHLSITSTEAIEPTAVEAGRSMSSIKPAISRDPFHSPSPTERLRDQRPETSSPSRIIQRKPLADIQSNVQQARPIRSKNVFFNAQGQRIDSRSYANQFTQRYLQC